MTDWAVGDLAVCVNRDTIVCPAPPGCGFSRCEHLGVRSPRDNRARCVVAIVADWSSDGLPMACGCVTLVLHDGAVGISQRFRKIRPDEHEACEEEFQVLLKRTKVTA